MLITEYHFLYTTLNVGQKLHNRHGSEEQQRFFATRMARPHRDVMSTCSCVGTAAPAACDTHQLLVDDQNGQRSLAGDEQGSTKLWKSVPKKFAAHCRPLDLMTPQINDRQEYWMQRVTDTSLRLCLPLQITM